MRDARRFSAWEVSQGVQRRVLVQTTWFGSTVTAHSALLHWFSSTSPPGSVRRIMDGAEAGSR